MDVEGLRGERVRLIRSEPSLHLEAALRWFNDPEVTGHVALDTGLTRKQAEGFFARVAESDRDFHWAIVAEGLGHVGFVALHEVDWRNRLASGGLILGERAAWGKGLATEAVRVRKRFAFDQLGLHRVEGHTFNPAMRRVYEKAGYTLEGVARQRVFRGGRFHDVWIYGILAGDPAPVES